jgi:glutathione S-transferase
MSNVGRQTLGRLGKHIYLMLCGPNDYLTPHSFVLNMKKIPYKTVWIEYPDIKTALSEAGVPHTEIRKDGPHFTCPAIIDPEPIGESENSKPLKALTMADSFPIAEYLDAKYPSPPLFPHGTHALQKAFIEHVAKKLVSFGTIIRLVLASTHNQLPPRSQEYYRRTREQMFGSVKLEDVCPPGPKQEEAIEEVRLAFDRLDEAFADTRSNAKDGQLVVEGSTVYADCVLAAWLVWIRVVAPDDLWWKHFAKWNDGRWESFVSAMLKRYGDVDVE